MAIDDFTVNEKGDIIACPKESCGSRAMRKDGFQYWASKKRQRWYCYSCGKKTLNPAIVEEAPFDRIMVTAVSKEIPQQLVDQLKIGGKMLIPHNPNITNPSANNVCDMFLVTKDETGWKKKNLRQGCKFVPFLKDFTID